MSRRPPKNPHLKSLEAALAGQFGWQPGGALRDELIGAVTRKADRIGVDEVSYCRIASASPVERNALVEDLAPAGTAFFRDPAQTGALRDRVLPGLVAARAGARRLRVWSAGTSTGEEAYSIAILAREVLPPDVDWRAEILATDVHGGAVVAASRGRFRATQIRAIDPQLRNRYFIGVDEPGPDREFDVLPLVRRMIVFRRANLCDDSSWRAVTAPFDVILCQNVLLYFHPKAAARLVERFAEVLADDGFLVVAASEAPLVGSAALKPDPVLPEGFFTKGARVDEGNQG